MTDQIPSSPPRIITDPDQARFLADIKLLAFLLPFLGRVSSVSQAAAELDIKVNTMLYRVQQMQDLGLLTLDHLEPRDGRAIRHYRAVADVLFVPFTATLFETLQAQTQQGERTLHQGFVNAMLTSRHQQMLEADWGTLISRNEAGIVNVDRAYLDSGAVDSGGVRLPRNDLPFSMWSQLALSPEQAQTLSQRLRALFEEYTQRAPDENGETYLLHLGFSKE